MPKALIRKKLWIAVVGTVISLGLTIFVSQFAYHIGFENLPPISVINITLDIVGMLIAVITMIGLYLDKRKTGTTTRYLAGIIIITYIMLLTDSIEYIMDGITEYRSLNMFVTVLYYMTIPAEGVMFWHYTINYLKMQKKRLHKLNCVIEAFFLLALIIRLLNIKYPIYFSINEMGEYHRTPYYAISKVFFLAISTLTLVVIMSKRKQFRFIQLIAVFIYAIGPIAIGIITITKHYISATPIVTMIATLFMYCFLNVTQGREHAVAEHEMSIAASIQENVLPKAFPYLPDRKEFELYAVMKPAKEVGGDFYDFFMVDDNQLALVIADVSGKGIPAALFMMTSRTLIKNRMQAGGDLANIMCDINNQLCEGNIADLFITVWVAVIDLQTGHGIAINAGHENPIIRRGNGEYESVFYKHDLAIAMVPDAKFHKREFELNPGDRIFVFTDGVTEAMNLQEELFGSKRLLAVLNANKSCSPKGAIEKVNSAVESFMDGTEQFDDTTMLCVDYNGL